MKPQHAYEKDFYDWTMHNARLIREGNFSEIDRNHIAEELESMGKSDKRELINRFAVLIAHLLKWQFQPERRSNSWKYTIEEQRVEIKDLLEDSPSLKHALDERLQHSYKRAVLLAATDTGLNKSAFPATSPFTLKQITDIQYFPKNL